MNVTYIFAGFLAMLGMMVIGVPIAIAMAAVGIVGGLAAYGMPFINSIAPVVWGVHNDNLLTAIPLFVLMGELLLRSVRQEAPVAGALTLMKLRRATSREDLEALLDEVEQRLRKPHRQIIAAQTLRHVRHLLGLPTVSRPS